MNDKWWCVTLLVKSIVKDEESGLWLCDEQVRVIKATDFNSAFEKSIILGKNQEHSYENIYGQTVKWEFIGLRELREIVDETIGDGTEIKSKLLKIDDPVSLIQGKDQLLLGA